MAGALLGQLERLTLGGPCQVSLRLIMWSLASAAQDISRCEGAERGHDDAATGARGSAGRSLCPARQPALSPGALLSCFASPLPPTSPP